MFQLLKHWDILQNIFFCVSQKKYCPFKYVQRDCALFAYLILVLQLKTAAEDSSSLQYTHNPGLSGLCLCVCVSESPPITPSVWAMECDGSLKKNKAPHLPLSLICTWRAAVLYDKLARPNTHSHKHNRVYTPTQNALGAQPCSRGHCKQLKSICLC